MNEARASSVSPVGAGPDWAAPARGGLTLMISMGLARCEALVAELRAAGMDGAMDGAMPAAAIAAAHTSQQRQLLSTLDSPAQRLHDEHISSPAIPVIGEVVREAHGWASLTQQLWQCATQAG